MVSSALEGLLEAAETVIHILGPRGPGGEPLLSSDCLTTGKAPWSLERPPKQKPRLTVYRRLPVFGDVSSASRRVFDIASR